MKLSIRMDTSVALPIGSITFIRIWNSPGIIQPGGFKQLVWDLLKILAQQEDAERVRRVRDDLRPQRL